MDVNSIIHSPAVWHGYCGQKITTMQILYTVNIVFLTIALSIYIFIIAQNLHLSAIYVKDAVDMTDLVNMRKMCQISNCETSMMFLLRKIGNVA
jgi:hypothetical protein